ncbi:MAG: pyridoxamine 5'-phosphate oxidase family protein [Deltaproteobacteria bacterium]|nr:pyridoxamine 5'-phosphate oxidase family protein [Deltaproteobacteria bacterium]
MKTKRTLTQEDMDAFALESKVGLLATVNPRGLPHITLITSLMAHAPGRLVWGQFSEGKSKTNIRRHKNCAFLVLTMDRRIWRGRALWTHEKKEGPEYELFNSLPMFRYNAYTGIHTVHYMELMEAVGPEQVPLFRTAAGLAQASLLSRGVAGRNGGALKPWAYSFLNRLTTLKFIASVSQDGFPWIIPCLACRAADQSRLVFSPLAWGEEFSALPSGAPVAVFGLGMEAESVLVRGSLYWFSRLGTRLGVVDIDWVYNSMPPIPGQIYPQPPLEPVEEFPEFPR